MGKLKPTLGKESLHLLRTFFSILGFVLFFNLFLFHAFAGVSFSFFFLGFFLFSSVVFLDAVKKEFPSKIVAGVLLPLVVFSVLMNLRANEFVKFLLGVGIVGINGMYLYGISRSLSFFRSLSEALFSPIILAKDYAIAVVKLVIDVLTPNSMLWSIFALGKKKNFSRLIPWGMGIIIAVPIFFILVSMFSSADPIFSSYVTNLEKFLGKFFQGAFWQRLFARLILSAIFAAFILPFLYLTGRKTFSPPVSFLSRFSLVPQATVVMAFVSVALGVFLLIQWPYVFISVPFETDLSRFGVATYSEYVKKGFGELLNVSILIYILIWIGLIIRRQTQNTGRSLLAILQLFLLGEYLLFLFSIARRIFLYQEYHGWSLGRVYGGFLLLWIMLMAVTLALRHMWVKRWVIVEVTGSILIIIVLGLFNAEQFLATVHPPTVNKRVDYVYLSRLSADGVEGWKKAFDHAREVLQNSSYDNTILIDKENRRQIVYAGIILHAISRNYSLLIEKFGSENDKQAYYRSLLKMLEEQNSLARASVTPIRNPVSMYRNNRPRDELIRVQQRIEEEKERVSKNDFSGEFLSTIYIPSWPPYITFDSPNEQIIFYDYFLPDPSYTQSLHESRKRDIVDQLFTWNYSEVRAFGELKDQFSPQELIDVQKLFLTLYQKIYWQTSEEKAYDNDISFDTPFLESL
ncbi:DUF4173 domain-containing protein [Candidatus Gottesmanbacteria bacterium]|nr:DUF4173 domain-containing protein [Candidatus Gottesmanbacteria bacterium]